MIQLPVNSQAPDVPELADQGIFQLSRLSVNCFVKTLKNPLIFSINIHIYFLIFGFRLNRLACKDSKTHFYIESCFKIKKDYFLGSNFINWSPTKKTTFFNKNQIETNFLKN